MGRGLAGGGWTHRGVRPGPLIAASAGIILLGLLRTPLRWSGAALLMLGATWALMTPKPDILISADTHNLAVRGRDGRLHFMRTAKDGFLIREWLAADADARADSDRSLTEGVSCDEAGCVTEMAGGGFVALAQRSEALADDCVRAVLVVTSRQPPADCAAAIVGRERAQRQGAMNLWRSGGTFKIEAVRPDGTDRPWSPARPGDPEVERTLSPRAAVPAVRDATPSETDLQSED
jgi:competence protein ComEC